MDKIFFFTGSKSIGEYLHISDERNGIITVRCKNVIYKEFALREVDNDVAIQQYTITPTHHEPCAARQPDHRLHQTGADGGCVP